MLGLHIIHLPFRWKRLTLNDFFRLKLSEKTLNLPKYRDVILNSISRTWEKLDSLVSSRLFFEWCKDAMAFCVLFYCLEPTLRKNTLMRTTESYLITAMVPVPFEHLWSTVPTEFWETPYSWRFYGQGSNYLLILSSRLWWNKNRWKCLENYHLQVIPSLHLKESCAKTYDISLIFINFFFSQIKLFLKFIQVLHDILDNFDNNWFTFLTFVYHFLEVILEALRFFL